jgi:hypothetical protein
MLKLLKRFGRAVLERTAAGRECLMLYDLRHWGYLHDVGYFESLRARLPIDREGAPIPWITYGSAMLLADRLDPQWSVFEWGSGNSTLWWAPRVKSVVSCEHDKMWYERMRDKVPSNVKLKFIELNPAGEYCRASQSYSAEFHVIVIDGRDRVNCARNCISALRPDGVVVWDNTGREKYQEGCDFLTTSGFRRLDFRGLTPANRHSDCTSVFYREDNCLRL